jgi:GNAT superfamily N-acetyltransferase
MIAEYIDLRARAGWGLIDEDAAGATINAAAFSVCLRCEQRLVGLARVMGDGALYFFLADLIVDPAFRGEKLGDRLMHAVTGYFERCAKPGASITLVPLKGAESFYEKFRVRTLPGWTVRHRYALCYSPASCRDVAQHLKSHSSLRSSGTLPNFRNRRASPNSPIMGSPVRLKATAPMLPGILDIISARRNAVVALWHSSAAPATSSPVSSCRNGNAT